jgi:serine/threonine protein kinase
MLNVNYIGSNYSIQKELGKGGMGTVYLGTDLKLERNVAIKVLPIELIGKDITAQEAIIRFQREAKSIAKLSHPNLVSVFDLDQDSDKYYMVMEYVDGINLASFIESKREISIPLVINIAIQLCNALDYVHEHNIIHRDIKPANIIVSKKGIPKLMDFGIAQLTSEQKKLTQSGSFLGSIMYTPPEQLQNASTVDSRADIYSLGVTLYEFLTGNIPFDSDNVTELFMKILTEEPISPSQINKDIPLELSSILLKSLKKDLDLRYQTAKEMALDLSIVLKKYSETTNSSIFTNTINLESPLSINRDTLKQTLKFKKFMSDKQKNYLWLKNFTEDWKTEQLTKLKLSSLFEKLMEPSLYGKAFSGILVIDKSNYFFIYDGNFLGAVNIESSITGDSIFQSISEESISIELKIPKEEDLFLIVILASIVENSSIAIQKDLNSSLVNISTFIDSITDSEESFTGYVTCYTEDDIIYYGFYNSKEVFSISQNLNTKNTLSLKNIMSTTSLSFNSFSLNPTLAFPSRKKLIKDTIVNCGYKNDTEGNLYSILEFPSSDIPIHLVKEVKQNTLLSLDMNKNFIDLGNNVNVNLEDIFKESIQFKFSEWLFKEYFYLLNSSGNSNSLKYIYSWIPATENIRFYESLEGEDKNLYEFDVVLHGQVKNEDYKKVLMLIRIGSGSRDDVEKFITESILVKKKLIKSGDIGGAIYISNEEFSSSSLKLFYERTVEPKKGFSLSSLDNLTKYKGFVRIGFGRGFHLNLIEFNKQSSSFNVIAPLLK